MSTAGFGTDAVCLQTQYAYEKGGPVECTITQENLDKIKRTPGFEAVEPITLTKEYLDSWRGEILLRDCNASNNLTFLHTTVLTPTFVLC